MNSRGTAKPDLGPEDPLTVAKNRLDLLMRPDKELAPWACECSAAASRGRMKRCEKTKGKEAGKGAERRRRRKGGKSLKVGR